MSTPAGNWIYEIGSATPGGGTVTPPAGPPAPAVTIVDATVTARSDGTQQIEVNYTIPAAANKDNFSGVHVYLEDPDISALPNVPLDGTAPLDASRQLSGKWNPTLETTSTKSPATILADGDTMDRTVRVYLLSYGPHTNGAPVRANLPTPTPNIAVLVPAGAPVYVIGQEHCWQITNPKVVLNPFFDNPASPTYTFTFSYTPPDPSIPLPPGMEHFGGVDIWYAYLDADNKTINRITATDVVIPVLAAGGYDSSAYPPSIGTATTRVYFVSLGVDNQPNTLVPGVTPYYDVSITYPPAGQGTAPSISAFTIGPTSYSQESDGSLFALVTLTWALPASNPRYSGVKFFVTAIGGVPQANPQTFDEADNHTTSLVHSTNQYPTVPQDWTITAISIGDNHQLADDPKNPQSFSPSAVWHFVPPGAPGGGGNENAPLVNIGPMAATVIDQQKSVDGVQMMRFTFTGWVNPGASDPRVNQFGGVKIAMQDSQGIVYFDAGKATSFTTPWLTAVQAQTLKFYWVSYDPQNKLNSILVPPTPERDVPFTPTKGDIIPSRTTVWWSPEFDWPAGGSFEAQTFNAVKINVGKTLIVGGAPNSFGGANGSVVADGQIAVKKSDGSLVGWIGTQQPTQGDGQPTYGAWFGQLWVGGHNPTDAPIWINNQGLVIVGGIRNQASGPPFILIQDQSGNPVGKMGAQLNINSDGSTINGAPVIGGAWFNQFALGGADLSRWNLLAAADGTIKLRDINLFQITYPNNAPGHTNHATQLTFGLDAYVAGVSTTYSFPGITIYDTSNGTNFGATLINRGLILTGLQGNRRVTLDVFNGDSSGANLNPANFFGELAMYNPADTTGAAPNVYLASGYSPSLGTVFGDAQFYLKDRNGTLNFSADVNGIVTARGGYYSGAKQVIDASGNWVGNPISVGSTGVSSLNSLTGALSIVSNNSLLVTQPSGGQIQVVLNPLIVNTNNVFVGSGIDIGGNGVGCGTITLVAGGSVFHKGFSAGVPVIDTTGTWVGPVGAKTQGVGGASLATWTGSGWSFGLAGTFSFTTADGKTITVTGGLITSHTP